MIEFLLADFNISFAIAFTLVITLGLLEGVGILIGMSVMNLLDEFSSFDVDADTDVSTGTMTQLLGWLCLHKLPLLVWIVLFASAFGVGGYVTNFTLLSTLGITNGLIANVSAIVVAILACRVIGSKLAELMPKNESNVVTTDSFAGKVAQITLGVAQKGKPAEAVLKDEFQQKHYLMVEPDVQGLAFPQGTEVVLINKQSSVWTATEFKK